MYESPWESNYRTEQPQGPPSFTCIILGSTQNEHDRDKYILHFYSKSLVEWFLIFVKFNLFTHWSLESWRVLYSLLLFRSERGDDTWHWSAGPGYSPVIISLYTPKTREWAGEEKRTTLISGCFCFLGKLNEWK